ncbi:hypothetical protein ACFQ6Q_22330 [Streptomyces sp. NPDC056437]|uniref:hypothetical protein n=1 Tax=Streptomyces sp. NPDC056437 TaxID=3345816 RepID=UPI00369CC25D
MEGCTNASALTREIQRLGYRGDVNTVRRHLKPYRNGAIPATAPSPHLTVRRVTDWTMRRPEHLTDLERKGLDELCERNPALATTVEYARRLALMIRTRRSEHLALDVWIADDSGPVEGRVNHIKMIKRQMFGRAKLPLLRKRVLLTAAQGSHRHQA